MQEATRCRPKKDFIRHIVNHVLAEAADKIPVPVFNDLRAAFSRAEDKFRFALFGGDPARILDYLQSDDWKNLVEYAKSFNVEWVLISILESLYNAYREDCPQVAEAARSIAEKLRKEESKTGQLLTPDVVLRTLRIRGYKVERGPGGTVVVEGVNFRAELEIVDGVINYTICRTGKTTTIEGVEAKMKKISEI